MLKAAADVLAVARRRFRRGDDRRDRRHPAWCDFNVRLAAAMLREAAAMTTQIAGEVIPSDQPGCLAMAMRQPAGVVLGIAPWNAPVILGVRAIAMPLACGNTVVLKASELCPATHRLIGKVLREAGLPKGVVNVVTNAPDDAGKVVEALIAHPAVRRINFTGSTRVGRIIAETAARYLKPVLLELGGKAPLIVLDDADLDEAVERRRLRRLHQPGPDLHVDRAHRRRREGRRRLPRKVRRQGARAAGRRSARGHVVLGSLVNQDAVARVRALIEDALAKGARLVAGGEVNGTVMTATVLDRRHAGDAHLRRGDRSARWSIVIARQGRRRGGPHRQRHRVRALGGGLRPGHRRARWRSRDGSSPASATSTATVHDEAQMPFGGTKASGYGRFGGKAAIDAVHRAALDHDRDRAAGYPF